MQRVASLLSVAGVLLVPSAATADERPRGSYVVLPGARAHGDAFTQPAPVQHAGQHVVFLNRCANGVTLTQGTDSSIANHSSIISGSVNFPPYPHGDAAWQEVVVGAKEIFSPFGITVTDVDPSPADHDEVIVCGT